jgi:hypothetical protein
VPPGALTDVCNGPLQASRFHDGRSVRVPDTCDGTAVTLIPHKGGTCSPGVYAK